MAEVKRERDELRERALNAEAEVEGLEAQRAGDDLAIEMLRTENQRLRSQPGVGVVETQLARIQELRAEAERVRAELDEYTVRVTGVIATMHGSAGHSGPAADCPKLWCRTLNEALGLC
jgi:hypothetical protein